MARKLARQRKRYVPKERRSKYLRKQRRGRYLTWEPSVIVAVPSDVEVPFTRMALSVDIDFEVLASVTGKELDRHLNALIRRQALKEVSVLTDHFTPGGV